ncbi:MAG: DUF3189 family protein [Bacillota bacterium]
MRLVYCDYRGLPLAAIAAAIRTGRLPLTNSLKPDELLCLPGIVSPSGFVYYGRDNTGWEVYAFWCSAEPALVTRFFQVRGEVYGEVGEWLLRPVTGIPGSIQIKVTWRLARLGFACGRGLFYRAVLKSYPHLARFALADIGGN